MSLIILGSPKFCVTPCPDAAAGRCRQGDRELDRLRQPASRPGRQRRGVGPLPGLRRPKLAAPWPCLAHAGRLSVVRHGSDPRGAGPTLQVRQPGVRTPYFQRADRAAGRPASATYLAAVATAFARGLRWATPSAARLGARLAAHLGMRVSGAALLAQLRAAGCAPLVQEPQVVGIDDWALARGPC